MARAIGIPDRRLCATSRLPMEASLAQRMAHEDRPMLGFESFRCARAIIAGIETMHMIEKGSLDGLEAAASSAADKFCFLAF